MQINKYLKYGKWALVTGASSGIGKAFANLLASQGFNLILVARRTEILAQLARQFSKQYNIVAIYKSIDLSRPSLLDNIKDIAGDKDISLLVSNAGVGKIGEFEQCDLEEFERNLFVNTTAHLKLAHWYSQTRIQNKKRGGMILVSSIAAYQGVGYATNYAASKAYVLGLAEGLHYELREKGIAVTALLPGPTKTPMLTDNPDVDMLDAMPIPPQMPETVAAEGLKAITRNKSVHISGLANRISSHIMPRKLSVKFWGGMMAKILKK